MAEKAVVVHAWYDGWNDGQAIDPLVERCFAPGAVWETARDLPDFQVCNGLAEIKGMLNALVADFSQFRCEIEELVERGDRILVRFRIVGHGPRGGVPIDAQMFHVHRVEDGRFTRVQGFLSRGDALAALDA